jgi:hypothetical protein
MSSLLVFNRVYRMEIQSVMLVFSDPLVNCFPSNLLADLPYPSPLPKVKYRILVYRQFMAMGGCRVLSCVVDHILREFITMFMTRFRTYKIATPTPNKNASKDDI